MNWHGTRIGLKNSLTDNPMPYGLPTSAQLRDLLTCRLCRQVTLLVCLSILLVEAAFLPPSYYIRKNDLYQHREQQILHTALGVLGWYEAHTPEEMLKQGWGSFTQLAVAGMAIYNDKGGLLASRGNVPGLRIGANRQAYEVMAQRPVTRDKKATLRSPETEGHYEILWSPADSGLPFTLVVRIGTADIDEELQAYLLHIAGLVLILSLCVSIATAAVLGRTVLSPLLEIHKTLTAAHSDPANPTRYKLDIRTDNEIGETATALNALLVNLSKVHRSSILEREKRLQDFAASSSDWFWEMDDQLRFCFFSERFTEVTGVDEKLLLGKRRDTPGTPELDPQAWVEHDKDLKARRPFRNFVYPRKTADGRLLWLSINGVPVFDDLGVFRGYRGAGQDVTKQVAAQHELMAAKEQAETANLTKSEFLANISHELRTPLNAIIGFSEIMLSDKSPATDPARHRDYLEDILNSGQHLLSLINDILDISKIEAGASEIDENDVDVAENVASVLRIVQQRADNAGVTIERAGDHDLPQLRADSRKLKQALLNLLANAIKFTPEGGKVEIHLTCNGRDGFMIRVTDTGIGIAAEDLPTALRQFGQVDSAWNRRYQGTGLGLPLTKALVELHDGSLDLKSRPNEGTTVTLRFPAWRIVHIDDGTRQAGAL
jgi:PAS domain S-box-containing protein